MAVPVVRCSLCRRVRDDAGSGGATPRWCDIVEFMRANHLRPSEFLLTDTYCDECSVFYRQLVTYGRWPSQVPGSAPGPGDDLARPSYR